MENFGAEMFTFCFVLSGCGDEQLFFLFLIATNYQVASFDYRSI